jgi:hypothetical protein
MQSDAAEDAQPDTKAEDAQPKSFVLARNHGMVIDGRSRFYSAGLSLDPEKDSALISTLVRSGATFE